MIKRESPRIIIAVREKDDLDWQMFFDGFLDDPAAAEHFIVGMGSENQKPVAAGRVLDPMPAPSPKRSEKPGETRATASFESWAES